MNSKTPQAMTMIVQTPQQKASATRRANIAHRNKLIVQDFTDLYQIKRIRYDDTLSQLSMKYALTISTITKILKKNT